MMRMQLSAVTLGLGVPGVAPFGRLFGGARSSEAAGTGSDGGPSSNLDLYDATCTDRDEKSCRKWALEGECESNPEYMREECRASCYACQSHGCHDNHQPECAAWADGGECAANHEFMLEGCAHACRVCGLKREPKCQRDAAMAPAALPGTIRSTFDAAAQDFPQYQPRVLSREPPVLLFEHFLSDAEADHVVRVGGHDFERSLAGDGVTPVRASWAGRPPHPAPRQGASPPAGTQGHTARRARACTLTVSG